MASLRKIKNSIEQRSGLAFGDVLNVSLFVLTLIAIGISILSLWVAIATKRSADISGNQQQETLESSRKALKAVVSTLDTSNQLLTKNSSIAADQQLQLKAEVKTSGRQLDILTEEWRRQLAQPDMGARLVNAAQPAVVVFNTSTQKPVTEGSYQLLLVNLDHPVGASFQVASNPAAEVNWIRPGGAYLPSTLNLVTVPDSPLKDGDRLFGYLSVDCLDCKAHRVYGVFLRYHQQGAYRELTPQQYSLVNFRTDGIEQRVRDFLALPGLLSLDRD